MHRNVGAGVQTFVGDLVGDSVKNNDAAVGAGAAMSKKNIVESMFLLRVTVNSTITQRTYVYLLALP